MALEPRVEVDVSATAVIMRRGVLLKDVAIELRYEFDDSGMTICGGQIGESSWRAKKTYPFDGEFRERSVNNTLAMLGLSRVDVGLESQESPEGDPPGPVALNVDEPLLLIEISGIGQVRRMGKQVEEVAVRAQYVWDEATMTVRGGQTGDAEWRVERTFPLTGSAERDERVDNTLRWFGLTREDIGLD